ncbi:hypothetical protein QYE76_067715 [Lolium multiflorum]|uniref:Uncharacterized protein n=1 Tax=Lolium multiflorum TaxID=4521 RepID=A0AAD8WBX5_LOLMU|nr:hypothetical protein QYE76_067715 [Lolium multiflorum]
MLKEFISTQTAFNKSVEEKLGKIDILASKVDSLAADVDLLKSKVMPNENHHNKIVTTANAIQVRINENIRLMAELRARWDREENEKLAKEKNVAKVWTITTTSNVDSSHVAAPPTINGKIIGVGNVSTPSAKRTKLPETAKTAEIACDKTAEIFFNIGDDDPIALDYNGLNFDDCHISEVIKFLQKLAKSPNASAINLAFTKHITNALIKAREEKLEREASIPRKLEDGWEPIIKMKVKDFDCNALCDLGASISVMPKKIYNMLDLPPLKNCYLDVNLADHSTKKPLGKVDNVRITVNNNLVPVDFVVLDIECNASCPIILGRPFLRTVGAIIDMKEAIMANTFPKRTLRKVEGWLGDYDGPITALLCGMLKELHCDPRIPVIKYTYYDGEILAKCRVSVQLPTKLLMSRVMPYGEAKTITTAYHMGLFKAILEIRQHKSVELLCSEFSHIPHAEEDEDPTLNHLVLAHRSPEAAAQHMDSCKSLLTTMYLLHMKMRGEIDHMLAEFTDPDKVQTRMRDLRAQPQHTTPFFSLDSYVDLSDQLSHKDPLTPNFVPHYPHVSASYESGYGGDDSRNLNCSESPIENSTGWRFGEPFGDEGEPITCDSEDEGGAVNQNVNQSFGQEEKDTNSISLDLEMGLPKTSQYVVGESSGTKKKKKKKMRGQVNRNPPWMAEEGELYPTGDTYESLSSYFGMTDLCLGTSSDSDYIPTGRTFIPDGVRKTNRCTGWTPGMYAEASYDDEE